MLDYLIATVLEWLFPSPPPRIDFTTRLLPELKAEIMSHLPRHALLSCSILNRDWRAGARLDWRFCLCVRYHVVHGQFNPSTSELVPGMLNFDPSSTQLAHIRRVIEHAVARDFGLALRVEVDVRPTDASSGHHASANQGLAKSMVQSLIELFVPRRSRDIFATHLVRLEIIGMPDDRALANTNALLTQGPMPRLRELVVGHPERRGRWPSGVVGSGLCTLPDAKRIFGGHPPPRLRVLMLHDYMLTPADHGQLARIFAAVEVVELTFSQTARVPPFKLRSLAPNARTIGVWQYGIQGKEGLIQVSAVSLEGLRIKQQRWGRLYEWRFE